MGSSPTMRSERKYFPYPSGTIRAGSIFMGGAPFDSPASSYCVQGNYSPKTSCMVSRSTAANTPPGGTGPSRRLAPEGSNHRSSGLDADRWEQDWEINARPAKGGKLLP